MTRVAVVGMACRYPDAGSPGELWENVVTGRRAFRRMPDVRTRLDDYWSPDPAAPDRFHARHVAVLRDYRFDRLAHQVAGSTFRSTDLTHWLALDVAGDALADAGFPGGAGLPRADTTVIVGNTLTGEFTRANTVRLRWPYVRRTLSAALAAQGWESPRLAAFLDEFERQFKEPFPAMDEDALAGGLSNTIAGRICNHFDLGGGGYTIDGACSSSLLSVITACRSLAEGDVSVAVAGGVDLSLDPFELVGFTKAGALARDDMRVYDKASQGFWPGEGCGMVVLMRERDARDGGHRIYATIAGWGVSSDGRGGITRPEITGHRLALRRAYARAGYGIDTVPLFEGHGTGTRVGDLVELRALSQALRAAGPRSVPAAVSSIKAIIGHTKAAAGVAGLIKAALALHHRVVPPTAGCLDPHDEIAAEDAVLRATRQAEPWPAQARLRAGVTALGFGGINTHLALDAGAAPGRVRLDSRTASLVRSAQDCEMLLLDAVDRAVLRSAAETLAPVAGSLARAELADLAATLRGRLCDRPWRGAVVASTPEAAETGLRALVAHLDQDRHRVVDSAAGVFLGHTTRHARIGYLFPGQGSGRRAAGGALWRRFPPAGAADDHASSALAAEAVLDTAQAQPRIVDASLAALRVLDLLGIEAEVAVGHSLGELTALCWAGTWNEAQVREAAAVRGRLMAAGPPGAMLSLEATADRARRLIGSEPVVVAGYNGPRQTVIAGPPTAVERCQVAAEEAGIGNAPVAVARAFHSPLMREAADGFGAWLAGRSTSPPRARLVSTVTGTPLAADADVTRLLTDQITGPVRFVEAVTAAAENVDLFVEVGPGRILSRLCASITTVPAVPIDTDDDSLASLLRVAAAAYTAGAALAHETLFEGRPNREFDPERPGEFLSNPCETAPTTLTTPSPSPSPSPVPSPAPDGVPELATQRSGDDPLEVLRELVAKRAELPASLVTDDVRLLDEMHLSSITVGQLVNQAARSLGMSTMQPPTNIATASLRELADVLRTRSQEPDSPAAAPIAGIEPWIRPFTVSQQPVTRGPQVAGGGSPGRWQVHAAEPDRAAAAQLGADLEQAGLGDGVLLVLPEQITEDVLDISLAAVQAAQRQPPGNRLVVVQRTTAVSALAKTAHLEATDLPTTVVTLRPCHSDAAQQVVADVAATASFVEVSYEEDGTRTTPTAHVVPVDPAGTVPLGPDDVLLVTGGGKGITAECALSLARSTGVRLALLGRSDPAQDELLAANLNRMRSIGALVCYIQADVTDDRAVAAAVADVTRSMGAVTGVLHGAAHNEPAPIGKLDLQQLSAALAPKIAGLHAVLAAVDTAALRVLVTFGSVIGRTGLPGEAHYGLANEWLARETAKLAERLPDCRTLCLEWSVWTDVGMGERLAAVEPLLGFGVTPISPERGTAWLQRLLADRRTPPVVLVSGRMGDLDTIRYHRPDLPLARFAERVLLFYPDVELVTEATLTVDSDPYLADHELDGNLLLPAVIGLEAMAQVARALRGREPAAIVRAEFSRPIVVPADGSTTLRVAALRDGDTVRVSVRSSETGYAAEHFTAMVVFSADEAPDQAPDQAPEQAAAARRYTPSGLPEVELAPARLYGELLFQGDSFRRLSGYRRILARETEFTVSARDHDWFGPFLPGQLTLGDPGARDAVLHGIQVCVPDATLLPAAVERIDLYPAQPAAELTCRAVEIEQSGNDYTYEVTVAGPDGRLRERWTALRLTAVARRTVVSRWPAALLGPLMQRASAPGLTVVSEPNLPGGQRRDGTRIALTRLLGRDPAVEYRSDGRPEVPGGPDVSASHGAGLTLAVAGPAVACDVEEVVWRTAEDWTALLGPRVALADLVAREAAEPFDVAATRVWCTMECLLKVGYPADTPLSAARDRDGRRLTLRGAGRRITTLHAEIDNTRGTAVPAVLAVLTPGEG